MSDVKEYGLVLRVTIGIHGPSAQCVISFAFIWSPCCMVAPVASIQEVARNLRDRLLGVMWRRFKGARVHILCPLRKHRLLRRSQHFGRIMTVDKVKDRPAACVR